MKLHLPIMMALFAVANYAQADDRLIFELGDTDKELDKDFVGGAVWNASSATLTVKDVSENNIGINYDLFSISFEATAEALTDTTWSSYGLFFQIIDLGQAGIDGAGPGNDVKDGFGYSISKEDPNKYKVNFASATDGFSGVTFAGGATVDKSRIEDYHKFTLVFEGTSVSGYVLESETYTELFQTTWYYSFEKITSTYNGYEMVFGVDNINNTTVSNIAFYNGDITKSIPEPTTATLGLMALAGLMARRRRK